MWVLDVFLHHLHCRWRWFLVDFSEKMQRWRRTVLLR